jgi:hypothetical protein
MDNLVILHTWHALNLLGVLLRLLRNQLLQVLNRILQFCSLSLTRLELLIPLVQLGLEVGDVVLRDGQLVLSVLQPCTSVIKEVVSGHKMHILTTNIPIFHSRYRRYVLITNEFHEFCSSTIKGTSDDEKAPYGQKSIHILIMSKTRGVLG